jgi:hypothetical protein
MHAQDDLTRATWWLAYATIGLVLTGVGGIIFVWLQLRADRRQKRVENLERQIEIFEGDRFRKARAKLASERLDGGDLRWLDPGDPPYGAYEILDFFEHVALLVREKNLTPFGVWHSFGPWIGAVWSDFKTVVAVEQTDDPATYCDFTWLVEKMKRIGKKHRDEGGMDFDEGDLEAHYAYEKTVSETPALRARRKVKRKKHGKTVASSVENELQSEREEKPNETS